MTRSRRKTPWTDIEDPTPLQAFIDACTDKDYSHRHPDIRSSGEAEWLNGHDVTTCRFCGSSKITKEGFSDNHKLPISQWIGFLLDIFGC